MIEANCPKCSSRKKFSFIKEGKYKCTSCNSVLYKCKKSNCIQMTSFGLYCNKCVGSGMKRGGAIALTGLVGLVVIALKVVTSRGRKL